MAAGHILAIDQGTTSSRAILFDAAMQVAGIAQQEFPQHFPASGWVEHDPQDLWTSTVQTCRDVMARSGLGTDQIAAIGITNQRETTLVWDRDSGKPIYNAIVWQDRRTADFCRDLREQGLAERRLSLRGGPQLCTAWEQVDALTVCAIEGWCAGGGAALAVSCDLRVVSESATLYVPEVERGMNMSWGSIPRITALVGPARAKRIAALCEKIGAQTALSWGLADEICADGQALTAAEQIAIRASALPPTAMKMVNKR